MEEKLHLCHLPVGEDCYQMLAAGLGQRHTEELKMQAECSSLVEEFQVRQQQENRFGLKVECHRQRCLQCKDIRQPQDLCARRVACLLRILHLHQLWVRWVWEVVHPLVPLEAGKAIHCSLRET